MIPLNENLACAPDKESAPVTRATTPMWSISGLRSRLDKNEDAVMRLIEEGEILFAFDLSLIPERAYRKELRVLPQAVEDFIAGRKCELEWDAVARLIVPHDLLSLTSLEIQRTLNVTSTHVGALIRRGLLGKASEARRGPGGSARVMTSKFLEFVKGRRYF